MDKYLAITQQTCSWLLSHPTVLWALHLSLANEDMEALSKGEFAAGPLRMAADAKGQLVAVWNREYVSGTGHESWGICRLSGSFGLLERPEISQQVFEREIYVFSQRLQSLIVDSDFIHRTWPNGSHTCLAGRGNEARQYSICYFEGGPGFGGLSARAIIAIGPGYDFDDLQEAIGRDARKLSSFAVAADTLTDTTRRPLIDSPNFNQLRASLTPTQQTSFRFDSINLSADFRPAHGGVSPYETAFWTYDDWISKGALNEAQRRVLESNVLFRHPVRVIGPAGSGKTLLMQLLALRYLRAARETSLNIKVMYIVHNSAMATNVSDRFRVLGGDEYLTGQNQTLVISTLSEYGRQIIGLSESMVIDKDAQGTKIFQMNQVRQSLRDAITNNSDRVSKSPLMQQVESNEDVFSVFSFLVSREISNAIKGRGLVDDAKRYINSETAFSRLHAIMNIDERTIVYDCFKRYHSAIFEEYEMLDSDDIALSLSGKLRTPLWRLKRKTEGFDYIFVDEAQLFNENERRVFPYLTTGKTSHVPIALALDEAQDLYAFSNAGLATLGIADVENENLPSNHRSTKEIVDLAFHIIQKTTDLFNVDFPDFEKIEKSMVPSSHPLAALPIIVRCHEEQASFGRFVVKRVQKLRAVNVRQICVVCHAETYWNEMLEAFQASGLPLHIIEQRGEKIVPDQPLVVLSRPAHIGGQEFDAVISIGLEQGVVPPRIVDNIALAVAVEQQVLREMYLVTTRARYRYMVLLNKASTSNSILSGAVAEGLISISDT